MDTQLGNIENFLNAAQDSLEQFRKMHMDNLNRVSELQLEFINLCAECNKAQMDRLVNAKSASDVMATESGIATEYSAKFFENAKQVFEAANEMQNAMISWMAENNLAHELEKLASESLPGNSDSHANKSKRKTMQSEK